MAGESSIDTGSGKIIKDQLNDIVNALNKSSSTKIKFQYEFNVNKVQKEIQKATEGVKKQTGSLTKQVDNAINKLAGMGGNADKKKYGNVAGVTKEFESYSQAVVKAQKAYSAWEHDKSNSQLQQNLIDTVRTATNEKKRLDAALSNTTAPEKQALAYNKVIDEITKYQAKNKETLKNTPVLAAKLEELNQQLVGGTFKGGNAHNRFLELTNQIRAAGGEAETLGQKIRRIFGEKLGYGIIASAAMMARRSIREMYNNVVQIDTAMTELKKVTNETDTAYKKFLDGSAERAQKLGAKISDVVTATADFARLGYNLEDASILSDTATIYKNVGDGISDINSASESIISTMKAFGYEASDAMSIVDKFNEVGNNYAISSKGVGDALLNSASAMAAANNTLDETIALSTAANTIVQNPEKVGTALKTVSMYLRAAKDDAEDMGESTEGMAESVSELQSKLLSLTGGKVNILQADGQTYKSTYQILKELSEVYDSLSDVSQANILELIGGKRNSNITAALLEGFDVAEKSLATSMDSAGSALEENEKYLDSINGKVAQLEATFQDLSQNVIDSETVKGFVDLGNGALKLVNFLAEIKALLPVIVAGFMSWKNVGKLNSPNMPAYAQLQLVA